MATQDSPRTASITVEGLLHDLERRLEVENTYGREVDLSLRELLELAPPQWSTEPRASVLQSTRMLRLAYAWLSRAANKSRALEMMAELALVKMREALPHIDPDDETLRAELLEAWRDCTLVPRELVITIYLEDLPEPVLRYFQKKLRSELMRLSVDMGALVTMLKTGTQAAPNATREHVLFLSQLYIHFDELDEAAALLEKESQADPRILQAWADLFIARDQPAEAVERLRKAAIVAPERHLVRQRIVDLLIRLDRWKDAEEQFLLLLEESRDELYWNAFISAFEEHSPELARELRTRLQEEAPSMHLRLLLRDRDVEGVSNASAARSLPADILWESGDFLVEERPQDAARIYERAFLLQGAAAQSRGEVNELLRKLEELIPFFEGLGRRTKPRRMAREVLNRARNPSALRREFEKLFDTTF